MTFDDASVEEAFRRSRRADYSNVLRRTGRNWLVTARGCADLGAAFFDPVAGGSYFSRTETGDPITQATERRGSP